MVDDISLANCDIAVVETDRRAGVLVHDGQFYLGTAVLFGSCFADQCD
jgi:hypothetical protein